MWAFSSSLVIAGLHLATPLILAALGGLLSERSGVINIALEGKMLFGAFFAVVATWWTGSPVLGLVAGVLGGAVLGFAHAFFSVTLRADQIVSATAINLLAVGITSAMVPAIWGRPGLSPIVPRLGALEIPGLRSVPLVGPLFTQLNGIVYFALLLAPVIAFVLFKTAWGLRLLACGESPHSATSVGINVIRVRYLAVTLSGVLAALGGVYLSIVAVGAFQRGMTQGRGFIALAALIFGKWRPYPVLAAALLFGIADGFQVRAQVEGLGVPHDLLIALPYLIALVALATFVGRASAPSAIGQPFIKE